jgi:hypothetical protein
MKNKKDDRKGGKATKQKSSAKKYLKEHPAKQL